jgi:hypothetical protein
VATLRSVAFGREPITAAERDGRLTVTGDRRLAEGFTRMFPVQRRGLDPALGGRGMISA